MSGYQATLRRANHGVKSRLSCLKGLSRKWLLFMNGFVLLGGIVLTTLAIFNGVNTGDLVNSLGDVGVVGFIASGAILVVIAAVGCCGVIYKSKFLLIIYLIVSFALAAVFLGAGIILTFLVNDLGNVDGVNSNSITDQIEAQVNDALVAVFNQCCATPFNLNRLLSCQDPNADQAACFADANDYGAALERVKNTGLCNTLTNVKVNGFPVVGDPQVNGGCANGDGVLFKQVITSFAEDAVVPIGGAFIGFGVLLMLTLIATCCVLCANQDEYIDAAHEAKEAETGDGGLPPPNTFAVSANNVATGEGQKYEGYLANYQPYQPPYGSSDKNVKF